MPSSTSIPPPTGSRSIEQRAGRRRRGQHRGESRRADPAAAADHADHRAGMRHPSHSPPRRAAPRRERHWPVDRRRGCGRRSLTARPSRYRSSAVPTRTAAFFDLDKTIIAKSSVLAFGKPFYQGGLINRRAVLRSAYAQFVFALAGADEDQIERMRAYLTSMCTGWDVAQVRDIVSETLHDIIDPIVYDEAVELIGMHKAAGRDVVIVSSSGEEVVGPDRRDARRRPRRRDPDGRRRRQVHRRDRALRLRPGEGRRDPRTGRGRAATTSRRATPTPTRPPTSRCSKRSDTRSRSTPTAPCASVAAERDWPTLTFSNAVPLRDRHLRTATRAPHAHRDRRRRRARGRRRGLARGPQTRGPGLGTRAEALPTRRVPLAVVRDAASYFEDGRGVVDGGPAPSDLRPARRHGHPRGVRTTPGESEGTGRYLGPSRRFRTEHD